MTPHAGMLHSQPSTTTASVSTAGMWNISAIPPPGSVVILFVAESGCSLETGTWYLGYLDKNMLLLVESVDTHGVLGKNLRQKSSVRTDLCCL